jgi:hypothetical protein
LRVGEIISEMRSVRSAARQRIEDQAGESRERQE